jgi:hydrogenase/urease accessory protein HupE
VLPLGWLLAVNALAHAPFESSIEVIVGESLQVDIKMGIKVGDDLLKMLGLSQTAIAELHRPRETEDAFVTLDRTAAARLFEVQCDGDILGDATVQFNSDGRDAWFRITFQHAATGELLLTAKFLKHIPNPDGCPIIVIGGLGKEIGGALLTGPLRTFQVSVSKPVAPAPLHEAIAQVDPVTNEVIDSARAVAPPEPAATLAPSLAPRPTFWEFLHLGVHHILAGTDHLLFLGALLIRVRRLRTMFWVITCFTLAHSVTLALSAMDLASIASRLAEPVIAASIIAVGIENLVRENQADRCWLAGGFGLIHGFGFAGALRETGLGRSGSEMLIPLASFNLGVEIGQLGVAAVAIPLLFALRKQPRFEKFGVPAMSVAVILVSSYWFIQRAFPGW